MGTSEQTKKKSDAPRREETEQKRQRQQTETREKGRAHIDRQKRSGVTRCDAAEDEAEEGNVREDQRRKEAAAEKQRGADSTKGDTKEGRGEKE